MGFLVYRRALADDFLRHEKVKPLKLAGPVGLIARHVETVSESQSRSWSLDTGTLFKLANKDAAEKTILFDVAGRDATRVCLYELPRIHGSCRNTSTQLALDLSVLIEKEVGNEAAGYAHKFEVTPSLKPRLLGEMLSLTGAEMPNVCFLC